MLNPKPETYPSKRARARSGPKDSHVMPNYGTPHESSSECWCVPEVCFVADSGAQVWLHKELQ